MFTSQSFIQFRKLQFTGKELGSSVILTTCKMQIIPQFGKQNTIAMFYIARGYFSIYHAGLFSIYHGHGRGVYSVNQTMSSLHALPALENEDKWLKWYKLWWSQTARNLNPVFRNPVLFGTQILHSLLFLYRFSSTWRPLAGAWSLVEKSRRVGDSICKSSWCLHFGF